MYCRIDTHGKEVDEAIQEPSYRKSRVSLSYQAVFEMEKQAIKAYEYVKLKVWLATTFMLL